MDGGDVQSDSMIEFHRDQLESLKIPANMFVIMFQCIFIITVVIYNLYIIIGGILYFISLVMIF